MDGKDESVPGRSQQGKEGVIEKETPYQGVE
jgi:hypothetical protein